MQVSEVVVIQNLIAGSLAYDTKYLSSEHFTLAIFLLLGTAVGIGMLVAGWFICPELSKLLTYESGIRLHGRQQKFSIRYYIIAMLFLSSISRPCSFIPGRVVQPDRPLWLCGDGALHHHPARRLFYAWKGALEWE
jgi:hypothetical protein